MFSAQGQMQTWWENKIGKGKAQIATTAVVPAKRAAAASTEFVPVSKHARNGTASRPGLPRVPGQSDAETKRRADMGVCIGCGIAGHCWNACPYCPNNKQRQAPLCSVISACPEDQLSPQIDQSMHDDALTQSATNVHQCSIMPGHIWKRLAKLTKPFDLMVGCNPADATAVSKTPDQFLDGMPEGHALINLSRCSALQAKQLIMHAQECRKRKAFTAVYLLPSNKDAMWKSLIGDVPHIARLRLTSQLWVHAHYQRAFVPDLFSWPCQIAGQEARALNDGGSQLNLLSHRWATKFGLAAPTSAIEITLGDGSAATASGEVTLKLQYGAYTGDIPVHIMQLPEQYDLILGAAFLGQTKAVAEHDSQGLKRLVLKKGNRKFTVNRPTMGIRHETHMQLLSAMQAGQAMKKKGENFFMVRVTDGTVGQNRHCWRMPKSRIMQALRNSLRTRCKLL